MVFGMGCMKVIVIVEDRKVNGVCGDVEHRWLIHVVPPTPHARIDENRELLSPPCSCLSPGEVRKCTFAGPYFTDEDASIRVFQEVVSCETGRVCIV
jgi:hypothetical protein